MVIGLRVNPGSGFLTLYHESHTVFLLKTEFVVSPQIYWIRLFKGGVRKWGILTRDKVNLAVDHYSQMSMLERITQGVY